VISCLLYTLLPTPIYTPTPKCIHVYSFELAPIYRLSTLIGGACSEHFPFPPAHPYLLALWLSALPFHFPTALSFPFPLHFAFWPQCISLQCPSHFLLMPINAPARSFNAHVSSRCTLPATVPPWFTFFTFACSLDSVGLHSSVDVPSHLGVGWCQPIVFYCFLECFEIISKSSSAFVPTCPMLQD